MADDAPIVPVLPPWKLKGTIYMVAFSTKAGKLPEHAYSPLEKESTYASPSASGKHHGGTSQIQVIRYTESPVGPYDELIISPGSYSYEVEEDGKRKTKKNSRISRIYVSQKYTCWNGRKSLLPNPTYILLYSVYRLTKNYMYRLEYPKALGPFPV